jgi:hypothetical protein
MIARVAIRRSFFPVLRSQNTPSLGKLIVKFRICVKCCQILCQIYRNLTKSKNYKVIHESNKMCDATNNTRPPLFFSLFLLIIPHDFD